MLKRLSSAYKISYPAATSSPHRCYSAYIRASCTCHVGNLLPPSLDLIRYLLIYAALYICRKSLTLIRAPQYTSKAAYLCLREKPTCCSNVDGAVIHSNCHGSVMGRWCRGLPLPFKYGFMSISCLDTLTVCDRSACSIAFLMALLLQPSTLVASEIDLHG